MKSFLLIIIATLGITTFAAARAPENLILKKGEQKTAASSKVSVKFISVLEDSRCPQNVNCVWAGNAKIQVAVSRAKKASHIFELNSMLKPQSVIFEGYEIKLESLSPYPGHDTPSNSPAVATVTITRSC